MRSIAATAVTLFLFCSLAAWSKLFDTSDMPKSSRCLRFSRTRFLRCSS
uniref:Uncharacterized protein n=1 Tax=Arundo donax TaxID=35708 RepID=A0A0A9GCE7_ARUDO